MNNILVSIDDETWDHKPSIKLQYKDWVDKFGNPRNEVSVIGARLGSNIDKVSPTSLARGIAQGKTWSPFIFNECPHWKRPRRIETLFKSCQQISAIYSFSILKTTESPLLLFLSENKSS